MRNARWAYRADAERKIQRDINMTNNTSKTFKNQEWFSAKPTQAFFSKQGKIINDALTDFQRTVAIAWLNTALNQRWENGAENALEQLKLYHDLFNEIDDLLNNLRFNKTFAWVIREEQKREDQL
jgi:hypothetical protein